MPEDWPYKQARELFRKPEVLSGAECEVKWTAPDVDGLVDFMCKKHGFQFVFAEMEDNPVAKFSISRPLTLGLVSRTQGGAHPRWGAEAD